MITDTKHSTFWTCIEYFFYAYFVTFPFINYTTFLYGGTSTRSLNLIICSAMLGIVLAVWLFQKGNKLSLVLSPLFVALTVYLGALTLSGVQGLNASTTFWSMATRTTGIWYFLALGIFMLMLWPIIADETKHRRLMLLIVTSTALYSVLYLFSREGLGLMFTGYTNEAFTFGNTSFAAMYLFGAFLLALYYAYQAETKKWWMYVLPVVLLINPSIINKRVWLLDFSDGVSGAARATTYVVLMSLVLLLGMWGISKIKETKTRMITSSVLFALALVVGVLGTVSLLTPGGYVREAYLGLASAARPLVWEISEKAIGERPALGWGADNFERVFEAHYDNRLLQNEYGNEAWFDRAHNVFVDQLVDNGVVGLALYLLVYLVVLLALLYVALYAAAARDQALAAVLLVYFALHLAELQTAFDTAISYPMLAFMFVSAAVLYHRTPAREVPSLTLALPQAGQYATGVLLLAFCGWSLVWGVLPLARAQIANGTIRKVGSAEDRIPLYPTLFGGPLDTQAFLWRTSTDFQRGIGQNPKVLEDPTKVENLAKEMVIFEEGYRAYLAQHPENFRAHLNLADVLIYQNLFGVNKLAEAETVLDQAIAMVPQSPQPYWMKSVAYLYMGKFALAREYAEKGLALNPKIKQSQVVVEYIESSIKTFPEIDLFFFKQI